jgi:hypothetical protein
MKILDLTLRSGAVKLSANKTFEYQIEGPSFMKDDIFNFNIQWTRKADHAGPRLIFGIYKLFWIYLTIYDVRHWNPETNNWEEY